MSWTKKAVVNYHHIKGSGWQDAMENCLHESETMEHICLKKKLLIC